jgi:hypothetical protein
LDKNNVAIVKKRKKLNKERKERFGGRVVLENDPTQKERPAFLIFWRMAAPRC